MKLINPNSIEPSKPNRKLETELVRAMRLENTQRSVVCYGWLGLSAFSIVSVLAVVVLSGRHILTLPEKVILALIAGTVVNGISMFATIIRSLFPKK
jgi:hypothetical protein